MDRKLPESFSGQLAQRDDQTQTGTCVRHALGKAITNYLHVQKLIDVKQSEVTRMLVQQKGKICGIRRYGPDDMIDTFSDKVLILQDTDNLIQGFDPGSWWEVRCTNVYTVCLQKYHRMSSTHN